MKLTQAQLKVINFLIENEGYFIAQTPFYNHQVFLKEGSDFSFNFKLPTLKKLIELNLIERRYQKYYWFLAKDAAKRVHE